MNRKQGTFLFLISHFLFLILLTSCSIQQKISKSAKQVINDSSLLTAHVGISIYEPATGKFWYNYQGINILYLQSIQNFLPVMRR
jgi:uncharacterized protein YcfL